MKRWTIWMTLFGFLLSASAQMSPVQVTVQRVSKKKSDGESSTGIGGGWILIKPGDYSGILSLRITVRNASSQPLSGVAVKWGIAKARVSRLNRGNDVVYGAEETMDLKPLESKVVETATVEASGKSYNDGDAMGEKLRGHGVQILVGGKVVWEEFSPISVKKGFENVRPVGSDAEENSERKPSGKGKKPKGQ